MNIVANNVASKLFVAFVAVAMLFTLTTPAKAATAEELQQMINTLTAQIAALQGQVGQGGQSTASGVCPYTWTRSLKTGTTGADVMKLQQFLNADAETRVSASGVGSVGMETEYFGPATAAAVSKFQVKYRSDVLSPSGLVNPTGFFGPGSMAKANMICNSQTAGDDSSDDSSDDSDDTSDDSDDTTSGDLSGEASLNNVEVADGEDSDDVEEGSEDAQVAEITVEFADGDAMVTRLDIALDATTDGNDDVDPWDTFEEVSLWVDGDEIARMDVTDEDDYLDEDLGTLRFSGLDIVAMEDEEVVIVVAVSTGNSVDGVSDGADWDVAATGLRFVDADDVTSTETTSYDLQTAASSYAGATGEFTIEAAGAGDSLDLETSSDDPDATTISLDEDNNVEASIFAFELSAEDSDGDVDLNEIVIDVTVTTASDVDDLVNDFRIEIDGESFAAESYTGTGMSAELTFDIDGDFTIAADEVATVVLFADFEDMESGDEGSTIFASTSPSDIDAEGADDITVGGSAKVGETHTLRTEGLDLGDVTDGTGSSDSTQVVSGVATDANYGTMFLTYEITAFGDNLFIKADQASRGASTTAGVAYTIEDSSGAASTTGAVSVTYDIEGADESGGYFELEDGETYEMTVTVNSYNPVGTGGTYNLQILSVGYASDPVNATSSQPPTDLEDYESDAVAIQS